MLLFTLASAIFLCCRQFVCSYFSKCVLSISMFWAAAPSARTWWRLKRINASFSVNQILFIYFSSWKTGCHQAGPVELVVVRHESFVHRIKNASINKKYSFLLRPQIFRNTLAFANWYCGLRGAIREKWPYLFAESKYRRSFSFMGIMPLGSTASS